MKDKTFLFSRWVKFLGRNGMFTSTGLDILESNNIVYLWPITSKKDTARCEIQIPVEDLPQLIKELQDIADSNHNDPYNNAKLV